MSELKKLLDKFKYDGNYETRVATEEHIVNMFAAKDAEIEKLKKELANYQLGFATQIENVESLESELAEKDAEIKKLKSDIHLLTKTNKITAYHVKEPINQHHVINMREQSKLIESLQSELKKVREIGVEMQREVNRKLSLQLDDLKSELAEKDAVLNTAKNDYWFMSCLLERTTNDKYLRDAVNDCIERMKFRKPMFEVLQKYRKSEW